MSELLTNQFAIEHATAADVTGIGRAHLQATLDTYPNETAGINEAWLKEEFGHFAAPSGDRYRLKTVGQAEANPNLVIYDVVKNLQGQIVGFLHVTRGVRQVKLEGLYLMEEARGTGVSDQLMERALRFAGDQVMDLEVVEYNERAINFYKKHGFAIVPASRRLRNQKLPVIIMQSQPKGGVAA